MDYLLRIEDPSIKDPRLPERITDIRQFLSFDPLKDYLGALPTISLPKQDIPGLGTHSPMIGWQWLMSQRHTIALYDPDSNKALWIVQERFKKNQWFRVFRRAAENELGLRVRQHYTTESGFISPISGRVYRNGGSNYILVQGTPAELLKDVMAIARTVEEIFLYK